MRASVLFEQRTPLKVEDVELEAPRAGEVRVRMAASGVCHSCLHAADGSWTGVPVPIVLGDEGAGVVEAVGPGVQTLRVGDHVILSWARRADAAITASSAGRISASSGARARACSPKAPRACRSVAGRSTSTATWRRTRR